MAIDATNNVSAIERVQPRRDPRPDLAPAAPRAEQEPREPRTQSLDARAVTRTAGADAAPASRPRPQGGEGERELVSISEEARQLLRRAREGADAPSPEQQAAELPAQDPFGGRLLAVRVGPAPIEDLVRPAAEERAADALSERAFLRELERVLSLPDRGASDSEPESELRLVGSDPDASRTARADPVGRGEDVKRPAFARSELEVARAGVGGIERSASSARLIGSEAQRAARREQEELGRALEPTLRDDSLVRATSLAPQIGVARAPRTDTERGADAAGPVDRQGAPALEAVPQLTQLGVLEADTSNAIVTRFLGNVDAPDPGPEPRPREVIGEHL